MQRKGYTDKDIAKAGILPSEYFERPTVDVARDLIGQLLVHEIAPGKTLAGRIVETEAYTQDDPACHAWGNVHPEGGAMRSEGRNAALFGRPGTAYVYLNYGMYWLLNVVTEPEGIAGAVLIRGVEPVLGLEDMRRNRPHVTRDPDLSNGPGKLTLAFGIGKMHHDGPLTEPPLYLAANGPGERPEIGRSSRIGISRAVDLHWRFFEEGNPYVSPGKPSDKVKVRKRR